jgi:5-methylcytosine-specific restriction endonuclease McrA
MAEPIIIRTSDRGSTYGEPILIQMGDGSFWKRCAVCCTFKPIKDFNKQTKSLDGYINYCKNCARDRAIAQYRQRKPEYVARARQWQLAHPQYVEAYQNHGRGREIRNGVNQRRRAQKLETQTEPIDLAIVFERDKGICGICLEPVDPRQGKWDLDHIVALRAGGTHTYDNVRVSHPSCNRRRKHEWEHEWRTSA